MIPLLLLLPQRRPIVRRVARRPVPYAGALSGGPGNDTFNFGTISGSTGPAGPPGPQGPQGVQGPPGTPGLVPVIIVTTTPYNVALTNYAIDVEVAGASSVVLPVAPTGTVFIIKDISGAAAANNITITGSTLIDGAPSATINTNYGSLTFIFNGTEWTIV